MCILFISKLFSEISLLSFEELAGLFAKHDLRAIAFFPILIITLLFRVIFES
jgi:hypothetical protein